MGGKVVRSEGLGYKAFVQCGRKNIRKYTVHSSLDVVFLRGIFVNCICLVCNVILCVFVVPYMYLLLLHASHVALPT